MFLQVKKSKIQTEKINFTIIELLFSIFALINKKIKTP